MTHHCKPSVSKQWKRQTVIRAQISLFMSTFERLWNTQPSFRCSSKVYCLWTAHTDLHVVRPDVLVFKTAYQDTATDYQIWFCSRIEVMLRLLCMKSIMRFLSVCPSDSLSYHVVFLETHKNLNVRVFWYVIMCRSIHAYRYFRKIITPLFQGQAVQDLDLE